MPKTGVIYLLDAEQGAGPYRLLSTYADDRAEGHLERIRIGEGLIGQCAADAKTAADRRHASERRAYPLRLFTITPKNVVVLPVLFEGQVKAVIEIGIGERVHGPASVVSSINSRRLSASC